MWFFRVHTILQNRECLGGLSLTGRSQGRTDSIHMHSCWQRGLESCRPVPNHQASNSTTWWDCFLVESHSVQRAPLRCSITFISIFIYLSSTYRAHWESLPHTRDHYSPLLCLHFPKNEFKNFWFLSFWKTLRRLRIAIFGAAKSSEKNRPYLFVFGQKQRKKRHLHRFLIALFKLSALGVKSDNWNQHRIIYPMKWKTPWSVRNVELTSYI